jgi:hypothetical protein
MFSSFQWHARAKLSRRESPPPDWAKAGTAKETVAKPKVQAPAKTTFNNLEDFMVMLAFAL